MCGGKRMKKKNLLFGISLAMAIALLLSPFLLKIEFISNIIRWCLSDLQYQEYKSAFIGTVGGMIGTFLAITGTLWVENIISKDDKEEITETNALIVYYDIKLFYREVSSLAMHIASILGNPDRELKNHQFKVFKKNSGIHIHADWISVVASLKHVLAPKQIEDIYGFYGQVNDMKRIIEKEEVSEGDMGKVNSIINKMGNKESKKYIPNSTYKEILDELRNIAKITEEAQ
jgi:hypothetical protein